MDQPSKRADQTTESWPANALRRGTDIHGYRVTRVLGHGGFGITYLALDLLEQAFAIKEFFPRQFAARVGFDVVPGADEERAIFEECRERFLREARVLLHLSRRPDAATSIVHVHTCFEANGTAYLVMDYVQGADLGRVLRDAGGTLGEERLRGILNGVLVGLHVVHEAGVAHRDIKPANIVVRPDDTPVLIDFGASRDIQTGQTSAFTQIYSGNFTPPEQYFGESLGPSSDLYAAGAVAYRCIGGALVESTARHAAITRGKADPMQPATDVGQGRYAPKLLETIDRALRIDPAARPQSALEMARGLAADSDDLTRIVRRTTGQKPKSDDAAAAVPPSSRKRTPLALIGAAVLGVAIVAGGIAAWRSTQPGGGGGDAIRPEVKPEIRAVAPPPPRVLPPIQQAVRPEPAAARPVPIDTVAPNTRSAAVQAAPGGASAVPSAAPLTLPSGATAEVIRSRDPAAAQPAAVPAAPVQAGRSEAAIVQAIPQPTPPVQTSSLQTSPFQSAPIQSAPVQSAPIQSATSPSAPVQTAMIEQPPAPQPPPRPAGPCASAPSIALPREAASDAVCRMLGEIAVALRLGPGRDAVMFTATDSTRLAQGARGPVVIAVEPATSIVVDVFQPSGPVQHVQGTRTDAGLWKGAWTAAGAEGSRVLLIVRRGGAAAFAGLGRRPANEPAGEYLAALARELQSDDVLHADIQVLTVTAAQPRPLASPGQATTSSSISRRSDLIPAHCGRIIERAQLGETLSDADLASLRTECRR